MRIFVQVLVIVALMAMGGMGAGAQDSETPCAAADVLGADYESTTAGEWIETLIASLNTAADDDNMTDYLGLAADLRTVLARVDAECRGLRFTAETEGQSPVIGPVAFASGIWQANFIATEPGYYGVKFTALSGDCDPAETSLLVNQGGETDADGIAVLFEVEDCEVLIEVDAATGWELNFVPRKLTGE